MKTKLLIILIIVFWTLPLLAQEVDTAWVRRYNGPGNAVDGAYAIAMDGSGNIYVTGQSEGSGTGLDYATIKYYPGGDTAWVTRYNGPGNADDGACAIAVDGSGNVYVTGWSYGSGTGYDYATIKYYPGGDTAWVRRYNGPGNADEDAPFIAVDGSGNVYVTGRSEGSGTGYDYATIKYYPGGDTAWVRRYNGPGDSTDDAMAIAVDGSGNVYVTGWSYGSGTGLDDYATIKYYPGGDTAWVRRYNGPGNAYDEPWAIAVDGSGNVYVTGRSEGSLTSFDCATIKYYPNGDTVWVRRYNGPGAGDGALAIAVDGSGNVYVTGWSYGSGTGLDYATIKYYPSGDTAWVRRYNGPENSDDGADAIAVDGSGNVYVTGGIGIVPRDYATIRYYPNGDTAWVRRYNGPGNSYDYALAIAVDGSGNVYVTGWSHGSGTDYDYATIKYHQHNDPPDSFSLFFPPNKAFTPRGVHFDWETATDPNPFDQVKYDLYVSTSYRFPPESTTVDADLVASEHIKALDYGTYYWKVKAKDNYGAERWSDQIRYFMVTGIHYSGDINRDGLIDIGDVVFLITYLYTSGPAPEPLELGDVNCDDGVDIGDVVFLINYLFNNGPPPSC
jgi:hypothetical protein